ncbi:hypothetical protein [Thalassospira tepidiphila]|uniref:hypothetical protein n=1 Tax=Thalassospira tepidiphila TaxID=393657 RepID=UPI003AA85D8C
MVSSLEDLVVGLSRFADHFAQYIDRFVIIGGTACRIILDENAVAARTTKDLDIVLCLDTTEKVDKDFAAAILKFIEDGGYEARTRATGEQEYYRFETPKNEGYPMMLEFFSRRPNSLPLTDEQIKCRLVVESDLLSLSAILLDEEYYAALLANKTLMRGLPILNEDLLIPFKAKAHVDLEHKRANGDPTAKQKDISKHRGDIIRLLALIPPNRRITLSEPIKRDVGLFTNKLWQEKFPVQDILRGLEIEAVIKTLEAIYQFDRNDYRYEK